MLNFEDFYYRIWTDYIQESDVSFDYREQNKDFIRQLTFSAYKKYQSKNVSEFVYAEMIKLFFHNLFLYSPETFDSGEIRNWNTN